MAESSSGHWPASDVGGHSCRFHVDGPLNLLCDRLWLIPCWGIPNSRLNGSRSLLTRLTGVNPIMIAYNT